MVIGSVDSSVAIGIWNDSPKLEISVSGPEYLIEAFDVVQIFAELFTISKKRGCLRIYSQKKDFMTHFFA